MAKTKNPNLGRKINTSGHVYQVVKMMHDGISDDKIVKMMYDRYSFSVSIPVVWGFRHNFYEQRLKELKNHTEAFAQEHTSRMKTYIEEAGDQVDVMKQEITSLENYVEMLEDDLAFTRKFDDIFKGAVRDYVDKFDPEDPKVFLDSPAHKDSIKLRKIKDGLGEQQSTLSIFIANHNHMDTLKVIRSLRAAILSYREQVVGMQKDVFKSYQGLSMTKELALIFERYNNVIIQNFFPDRKNMDRELFERVRRQIFGLFDELQARYQGISGDVVKGQVISKESVVPGGAPHTTFLTGKEAKRGYARTNKAIAFAKEVEETLPEALPKPEVEVPRLLSTIEQDRFRIKEEKKAEHAARMAKERQIRHGNSTRTKEAIARKASAKALKVSSGGVTPDEQADIINTAAVREHARQTEGTPEHLFESLSGAVGSDADIGSKIKRTEDDLRPTVIAQTENNNPVDGGTV